MYHLLTLSLLRQIVAEKLVVHLRTLSLLLRAGAGKLTERGELHQRKDSHGYGAE